MNEQLILIKAKLIEARNAMRRLHGDNWQYQISAISSIIQRVAKEGNVSFLSAVTQIAEQARKDGQPMTSLMVLAVACEITENEANTQTKTKP